MIDLTHRSHSFLGARHLESERRSWVVIWLCLAVMVAEIAGGWAFGSIALVADGLHMSTHAGALLLAALAYAFARRHEHDERFSFGTGKLGDLAAFTSAVILAMIALLIGWEAVARLFHPVPIRFTEGIAIAGLGLAVNIVSAGLLGAGQGHHDHAHAHGQAQGHDHHHHVHRDNNLQAAVVHVTADAAVSVLVIVGLLLGRYAGWSWMDPVVGIVGALVIASWSYTLIRSTAAILLDMTPDRKLETGLRRAIEAEGDRLADLHLWRLGPGHLGAILSVVTPSGHDAAWYHERLAGFEGLSHLTIEVLRVS